MSALSRRQPRALAPRVVLEPLGRDDGSSGWSAIGYVAWTMVPVAEAVLFSFNSGRSITQWEGFSLRWYTWDPTGSVLHNPQLQHAILQTLKLASLTALFAVPPAVVFALALHHWRRPDGSGTQNFLMMFSFVTPELILAVSLFLLMTQRVHGRSASGRRRS